MVQKNKAKTNYTFFNLLATCFFGSSLLIFMIIVFFLAPDILPEYKFRILGITGALLAGFFGLFLSGSVIAVIESNSDLGKDMKPRSKLTVRATGGMSLFIITIFWWSSASSPVGNFDEMLKEKRMDTRKQLEETKNNEKQDILKKRLTVIESLLKNTDHAYREREADMQSIAKALDGEGFSQVFTPSQLEAATRALSNGKTALAEMLLQKMVERGTEQSSQAAYQLGQLAESSLDFNRAAQYFSEAFWRVPSNPEYKLAAKRYIPENELLKDAAWKNIEVKSYEPAITLAEDCIDAFAPTASKQQRELLNSNTPEPPSGNVGMQERERIFAQGLVNDVATCWFIKGRALEKLKRNAEAITAYCEAAKYTYARTYDPSGKGSFWSPAQASKDRASSLGGNCKE